ncbi:MAG: serine/threonine-protein phosphatase [Anaerolineales bacterium]|nr:serine/threonine-protein phosphatase [Anaerolineales bacterium]
MNSSELPHLGIVSMSHPGEIRSTNEDRFKTAHFTTTEKPPLPVVFAVVADGIGGHQAGEVAAEITVTSMLAGVTASNGSRPLDTLKRSVLRAWNLVYQQSEQQSDRAGMGSTVAAALVIADKLYTVTVGDSRIYLLHHDQLRQISIDHTWVQEALEHGVITHEEAEHHPNAHILRRHIGGQKPPEPDIRLRLTPGEPDRSAVSNQGFVLSPGDQVLLCSDGLTDLVKGQEIQSILIANEPQAAVKSLVQLARMRGGHDNITIVLLTASENIKPQDFRLARFLLRTFFSILILLLITAMALAAGWWFGIWPWI